MTADGITDEMASAGADVLAFGCIDMTDGCLGSAELAVQVYEAMERARLAPAIPWFPVSPEHPVSIRPLRGGGVEVALCLPAGVPAQCEDVLWSRSGPRQLVPRLARAIAEALLSPAEATKEPPE